MRIVHYLNHTCKGNGHVAVAIDLACEQIRVGHDVHLVFGWGDFDDLLLSNGVKIVRMGEPTGPLRHFRTLWSFLRAIRKIRPDVLNAHMVYSALIARLMKPLFRYSLVTTIHNSFDSQARLMGVGDRVIAVSDAVRQEMEGRGIPAAKLRVVMNGTAGGIRRPPYSGTPESLSHPAVVTVCGLHSRKGVAHLIDGFDAARTEHPDAHLYLVGGGPEKADFIARAQATKSAEHIHFLGYREDPRDVLASADLFVLASLRDPCPLVIFEAREMANPIIASAVDGIPESLAYGQRGVLVPPGDPNALAREISRLLSDEPSRTALGRAAAEDPEEISVRRMSSETVNVYAEAIGA